MGLGEKDVGVNMFKTYCTNLRELIKNINPQGAINSKTSCIS